MASEKLGFVRGGMGAVRPYVYGNLALWNLVKGAFGAEEILRHEFSPTAFHIEARIDDSVIVLEVSDPPHASGKPGSIYLYVRDTDTTYRRALELGAVSIAAPENKPYQERQAGVRDSSGNTWWISTFIG